MREGNADQVQVEAGFYGFNQYAHLQRWISFWYQIDAVQRQSPASVLEIGAGLGVTTTVLRQAGVAVTTFDFDVSLTPDLVGDVRQLGSLVAPRSFDLVCAFQVLEHLPFTDFETTVAALARSARRNVVLSLPHWGYPVEFRFRFLKNAVGASFGRKLVRPKTWRFDGQHYWELGTKGHSVTAVTSILERHLVIERQYFCPEYSYHYFFECSVRS